MKNHVVLWALVMLLSCPVFGQILRLAELSADQVKALDRTRTVVLMPGGVLEEHGPYLPVFTDGYMNEWWTERIAEAIVARPGWVVLIFPTLPLGDGGANEIGGKFAYPGSYGIRVATLRAVYMDLATELGEQGFRWIFVIQNHGSSLHHLAIDQACEYFSDSYAGQMVNLTGLTPRDVPPPPKLSEEAEKMRGVDIHAGISETSRIMFIKPHLVHPQVTNAPSFVAATPGELVSIARKAEWTGYFSSPRYSTAAHGAAVMKHRAETYIKSALQILDGKDPSEIPRYATSAVEREKEVADGALAYDAAVAKKQAEWLKKRGGGAVVPPANFTVRPGFGPPAEPAASCPA